MTFRSGAALSIATITFSPAIDIEEEHAAEHYELSVVPEPVMQPPTENIPFTFEVTVNQYTAYTITITSVSCGGTSSTSESFYLGMNL